MNKKFFNINLMLEGMRQVKIVGIIAMALMLFASAAQAMFVHVSSRYYDSIRYINMDNANCFVYFVMLFAPVMVVILFGFMNKRNACDFYHALPYRRECLYISFLAAAFIWCLLIILEGALVTILFFSFYKSEQLVMSTVAKTVCSAVIGVIYVCCVMAFAISMTGTYLTNIIVAIMLIFVPRGFALVFIIAISKALPFVPISFEGINGLGNIVFHLTVDQILDVGSGSQTWNVNIYTLVLSAIYGVAGGLLFKYRKSENATKASISRALQCFFRLIPSIAISLLPIFIIFDVYTSSSTLYSDVKLEIVFSYIFSVLAYFIYELVTTRKLSNLVKAIPGLGFIILANIVFIGGLFFKYDHELNFMPDADEVEYITIDGYEFWENTKDVKLSSDEILSIACDGLKDTVNRWKNKNDVYSNFYNDFYNRSFTITYCVDGKKIKREVIIDNARYTNLVKALGNEQEFTKEFYNNILDYDNEHSRVSSYYLQDNVLAMHVAGVMEEEIKDMPFSEMLLAISDNKSLFDLAIIKYDENMLFSREYYLNIGTKLPRTTAAFINSYNKQYAENEFRLYYNFAKQLSDYARNSLNDGYKTGYSDVTLYFNAMTIDEEGVAEKQSFCLDSYISQGDGSLHTDEVFNILEQLCENEAFNRVEEITAEDIISCAENGSIILVVEYNAYIENPDEYGNIFFNDENADSADDELQLVETVDCNSVSEGGVYIIDSELLKMIKDLTYY